MTDLIDRIKLLDESQIQVLGTIYTIEIRDGRTDPRLKDRDAMVDYFAKIIVADHFDYALTRSNCTARLDVLSCKNLRHEIIHAFLFESGIAQNSAAVGHWAINEEMVDFFAIQWYKINEVFQALGI